MTRLTNALLVLITASAAFGCSAVVNNTLKMKDDAGTETDSGTDSGVADTGTADTGIEFLCSDDEDPTTYCQVVAPCQVGAECTSPDTPGADPDGCIYEGDAPNGRACTDIRFNEDSDFEGMCNAGNCEGCGDGEVRGAEQCDDGNSVNGDGCDNVCRFTCTADTDCLSPCSAPRTCDAPPGGGDLDICIPTGGPLPKADGDPCDLMGPMMASAPGNCMLGGNFELCCGLVGSGTGMEVCCGVHPGEAGVRCGPPPPVP